MIEQNSIVISNVNINQYSIKINFDITGNEVFRLCFLRNYFEAEYSEDISNTPKSIAVIPFLSSILPLAWLTNAKIYVDELDIAFYESIEAIKKGYKKVYPNLNFGGNFIVNKMINNNFTPKEEKLYLDNNISKKGGIYYFFLAV